MSFFIVFDRCGLSIFQKGASPPYLNSLIRSLPNIRTFSRAIQSDFCFAQSSVYEVFLGVYKTNNPELLARDIVDYQENQKGKNSSSHIQQSEVKTGGDINSESEDHKGDAGIDIKDLEDSKSNPDQKTPKNTSKPTKAARNKFNTSKNRSVSIITNDRSSLISSRIKRFTSGFFSKAQTRDSVKLLLETQLHNQNVSPSIADRILSETLASCPEMVTSNECRSLVRKAVGSIIGRIDHDQLLRDVKTNTPFVFAFVGPNGVGKSTSIAKTTCWLMRNGIKCLLVACDVFRAGAVEQLTAHANSLNCEIFDQGYSKSESGVLKQALVYAKKNSFDAVLVDTAGRTPHNSSLMEGLKKLLRVVPDAHVCYVAEALCGNDSGDHAAAFGNAGNLSSVFVTKVDCAQLLGQVLNLCVYANAPVLFVGTGQAHTSLEIIEPQNIADILLQS